jgi:hypothetical protein
MLPEPLPLPNMRRVAPDLASARADFARKLRRLADIVETGDRLAMFEVSRLLKSAPAEVRRLAQSWSFIHEPRH